MALDEPDPEHGRCESDRDPHPGEAERRLSFSGHHDAVDHVGREDEAIGAHEDAVDYFSAGEPGVGGELDCKEPDQTGDQRQDPEERPL